jgi:3-hydroxyacyl-CoA dehydrogenase
MGSGIAQVSAQAGYETTLVDIKQEFFDQSKPE